MEMTDPEVNSSPLLLKEKTTVEWTGGIRERLKCLISIKGIDKIGTRRLLFLIQRTDSLLTTSNIPQPSDWKECNEAIRELIYLFRMMLNVAKPLRPDKLKNEGIGLAFGRMCLAYLNWVVRVSDRMETKDCYQRASDLYEFLKTVTFGERERSLFLINLILASRELSLSSQTEDIRFQFMKSVLWDRNFYSVHEEAFLKFLALAKQFESSYIRSKGAIKRCLNDNLYLPPPRLSKIKKIGEKGFLKDEFHVGEKGYATGKDLYKGIISFHLVRNAKQTLRPQRMKKIERLRNRKFFKKLLRKSRVKQQSKRGNERKGMNVSNIASGLSIGLENDEGENRRGDHYETIDEIMTNGQNERADGEEDYYSCDEQLNSPTTLLIPSHEPENECVGSPGVLCETTPLQETIPSKVSSSTAHEIGACIVPIASPSKSKDEDEEEEQAEVPVDSDASTVSYHSSSVEKISLPGISILLTRIDDSPPNDLSTVNHSRPQEQEISVRSDSENQKSPQRQISSTQNTDDQDQGKDQLRLREPEIFICDSEPKEGRGRKRQVCSIPDSPAKRTRSALRKSLEGESSGGEDSVTAVSTPNLIRGRLRGRPPGKGQSRTKMLTPTSSQMNPIQEETEILDSV